MYSGLTSVSTNYNHCSYLINRHVKISVNLIVSDSTDRPGQASSVDGMPVTPLSIQIVASCLHARIPQSYACKPKDWGCATIGAFMTWRSNERKLHGYI